MFESILSYTKFKLRYIFIALPIFFSSALLFKKEDGSIDASSLPISISNLVKKFYVVVPTEDKKSKFIKTQSLIDKMICYIIVLALCISDYKMEDAK